MEQLSQEWFDARKGRVTGSQIGAILGVNPWSSTKDAMRSILGQSTFTGNVATEYGSRNEENAVFDFELETGITIKECGFIVHPEYDWLGASPDGLIGADAIAEIKCPFGLRENPNPEFKSLAHMPHYYAQVQYECFAANGRQRILSNGTGLNLTPKWFFSVSNILTKPCPSLKHSTTSIWRQLLR